ncbi:MAG: tRNA lysidine(34) synthetase TilS, partial [Oligoflexia bacterium]|nr:tRNA lysidine(34) synthetase TilS [Oligoflexia bacterium]
MSVRFEKQVLNFMQKMRLCDHEHLLLVAVSGGIDSMALLHCLCRVAGNRVAVVHVNHNTRGEENQKEQHLVEAYALKLGVECLSFKIDWEGTIPTALGNFEHAARSYRYQFFKEAKQHFSQAGATKVKICTAHHVDDSLEWSLLHGFKSSTLIPSLGIPVKRGVFIRPFMGVTKAQILVYAQERSIPFAVDASNSDLKYERNFLRQQIIPAIAKRFPSYLKHYVHRSNSLALKLGVSASIGASASASGGRLDLATATLLWGMSQPLLFEEELAKIIKESSLSKRGVLRSQLTKTWLALRNASGGRWGPLSFSGGVKVYLYKGVVAVLSKQQQEYYEEMDQLLEGIVLQKSIS